MSRELHFAENSKDELRWERRFDDKPALTSEPVRTTEDAIPARDRWRKRTPRKIKK